MRALGPIALGPRGCRSRSSPALVLVLGARDRPGGAARRRGGGVLIAFGVFRFVRPRWHPRWTTMRVDRPRADAVVVPDVERARRRADGRAGAARRQRRGAASATTTSALAGDGAARRRRSSASGCTSLAMVAVMAARRAGRLREARPGDTAPRVGQHRPSVGRCVRRRGGRHALHLTLLLAAVPAGAASLPSVDSGARPGARRALRAARRRAPQLENAGAVDAPSRSSSPARRRTATASSSTRTSSTTTTAPRARRTRRPVRPASSSCSRRSTGTLTYPTDPVFAEQRRRPRRAARQAARRRDRVPRHAQHARSDPARTGVHDRARLARPRRAPWPHGAGVRSPAELFLTVHGTTAELRDAATGRRRAPAPTATRRRAPPPDRRARPARGVEPGHAARCAWPPASGCGTRRRAPTWRRARAGVARPRPAAPRRRGAALFNVAFRVDEPLPEDRRARASRTRSPRAARAWSSTARGGASARRPTRSRAGDVSRVLRRGRLRQARRAARDDESRRAEDRPHQPHPRQPLRLRARASTTTQVPACDIDRRRPAARRAPGRFVGQLQPYALYVPRQAARRARGYGLTLLLHALSANHNQFLGSRNAVAVRRARRRVARRLAARAAARTASTRASPRPTSSRCGPTSRATTRSTRLGGGRAATRWAARAPTGSPRRWPDLFARGVPDRRARARRRPARRRCATSR